jgi:hypothetical protein
MSTSPIRFASAPARPGVLAILLTAGALVLPACGAGGGGGGEAPEKAQIEVTGDARKVEVKAPRAVKAGLVEIDLKNSSKGPRDAQIIRAEGEHSPDEFVKIVNQENPRIPDWIQDGGGVGTVPPGKSGSATQNLAPGTYFIASMSEGEGAPGTAEFKVEGPPTDAQLPSTDAEIVAKDYTFEVQGLKDGNNSVLFKNEGRELHHVIAAPMLPGKSLEDVKKFATSGEGQEPSGPPPIDFENSASTAVIDGGVEQVADLQLKKGKYALLCFISDRKGGPPHVMKGMISEVEVQ